MSVLGRVWRAIGLAFLCGLTGYRATLPCESAALRRDWKTALETCEASASGPGSDADRMRYAWALFYSGRSSEALAVAETLYDSAVADALYLGGSLRARLDTSKQRDLGRWLLGQALLLYLLDVDYAGAARASCDLSRVPREDRRFEDSLSMAEACVELATASKHVRLGAYARVTLAETYDKIGLADEAQAAFFEAEQLQVAWPEDLAWTYFKHALFSLGLRERELALEYLAAAERKVSAARAAGNTGAVARLPVAIQLNRAIALSELGRGDDALRELTGLPDELTGDPRVLMVQGRVAARSGDTARGAALLSSLAAGDLAPDYAVSVNIDLGRLHHRAGGVVDAEQAFRRAISIVEDQRRGGGLELRPWILAHRTVPYQELLALLVARRQGADGLAVAEALHARSWLDAVVAAPVTSSAATRERARLLALLRPIEQERAGKLLDGAGLLSLVGDREVVVYLDRGGVMWRAHVRAGSVEIDVLPEHAPAIVNAFVARPGDPEAAAAAGELLLPRSLAASREPLYVVASGHFARVPFPGLRRGQRYLIDERPLARLPGLVAMRCISGEWSDAKVFLGDSRGDLAHAADEVAALVRAHGGTSRTGTAVTRDALLAAADASLLHVAVHGIVGDTGGAIALNDGWLSAGEVLELRIHPRVVVLAGCLTAASRDSEAWGAFPSAFLAAGSRHVIATTRSVQDVHAAALMKTYYAQDDALDPALRLAAAQRAVAGTVPAAAWSSFSSWGVSGCPP